MSFEAKYRGKCARCGDNITPGDHIEYEDDYRGDLVHATQCAEQPNPDEPKRNERNCPDCFTIHAGECL